LIEAAVLGRPIDLVGRVVRQEETDNDTYADAVALVVAVFMVLLTLVFVAPLLWMLSTSFKTNAEAGAWEPTAQELAAIDEIVPPPGR
jgi:ABC-type glycerol-3-phosphate transport system permease component